MRGVESDRATLSARSAALAATICLAAVLLGVRASPAAIIVGETATAAPDTSYPGRGPEKAVDNSGITPAVPTDLVTDGAIEHDNVAANMWLTPFASGVGTALGQQLTIDLGAAWDLDGMRIWNYNEGGGGTDTGVSVYDLETSPNGSSWTLRQDDQSLAQAPGSGFNGYDGVYTAIGPVWANVRYVRFTIVDTYRGVDDRAGISEIMFSYAPEPASPVLLGLAALTIVRRRARRGQ